MCPPDVWASPSPAGRAIRAARHWWISGRNSIFASRDGFNYSGERRIKNALPFNRAKMEEAVAAACLDPTPSLSRSVQGGFAGQLTDVQATLQGVADAQNAAAQAAGAEVSRDDFVFSNWTPTEDYGPDEYAAL